MKWLSKLRWNVSQANVLSVPKSDCDDDVGLTLPLKMYYLNSNIIQHLMMLWIRAMAIATRNRCRSDTTAMFRPSAREKKQFSVKHRS